MCQCALVIGGMWMEMNGYLQVQKATQLSNEYGAGCMPVWTL